MNNAIIIVLAVAIIGSFSEVGMADAEQIEMKVGAGDSDCNITDVCYTPSSLMIKRGTDITLKNNDTLPHTVTSGSMQTGPNDIFNSGLMISNSESTLAGSALVKDGQYDYFCIVHPWMIGQIDVVKDFYVGSLSNSPEWFKQVSQWHTEGKIPDNEYYWAVGYLDDNKLLRK